MRFIGSRVRSLFRGHVRGPSPLQPDPVAGPLRSGHGGGGAAPGSRGEESTQKTTLKVLYVDVTLQFGGSRIVDPRIVDPRIVDPRMVDPKES